MLFCQECSATEISFSFLSFFLSSFLSLPFPSFPSSFFSLCFSSSSSSLSVSLSLFTEMYYGFVSMFDGYWERHGEIYFFVWSGGTSAAHCRCGHLRFLGTLLEEGCVDSSSQAEFRVAIPYNYLPQSTLPSGYPDIQNKGKT